MDDMWMEKALRYEAELDTVRTQLERYKEFFSEVAKLTVRHDVIESIDGNEYASVSPKNLSYALIKIDENWYMLDKSR